MAKILWRSRASTKQRPDLNTACQKNHYINLLFLIFRFKFWVISPYFKRGQLLGSRHNSPYTWRMIDVSNNYANTFWFPAKRWTVQLSLNYVVIYFTAFHTIAYLAFFFLHTLKETMSHPMQHKILDISTKFLLYGCGLDCCYRSHNSNLCRIEYSLFWRHFGSHEQCTRFVTNMITMIFDKNEMFFVFQGQW